MRENPSEVPFSSGVYGARRDPGDLREAGEVYSKHRVANIMQAHQIKAIRGYKAPRSIVGRPSILAPNRLQREFTVDKSDQAWLTDITYLLTRQGWLYLAVVIDLHPRKVVGWSIKPTLGRELAIDALFINGSTSPQARKPGDRTLWSRLTMW